MTPKLSDTSLEEQNQSEWFEWFEDLISFLCGISYYSEILIYITPVYLWILWFKLELINIRNVIYNFKIYKL